MYGYPVLEDFLEEENEKAPKTSKLSTIIEPPPLGNHTRFCVSRGPALALLLLAVHIYATVMPAGRAGRAGAGLGASGVQVGFRRVSHASGQDVHRKSLEAGRSGSEPPYNM